MKTNVRQNILNSLKWFLSNLKGNVVDNLASTSTNLPLSANQGRLLNDKITECRDILGSSVIYENNSTINITESDITKKYTGVTLEIPIPGLYLVVATVEFPSHDTLSNKRVGIWNEEVDISLGSTSHYGKNYSCYEKTAFYDTISYGSNIHVFVQSSTAISGVKTHLKAVRLKTYPYV